MKRGVRPIGFIVSIIFTSQVVWGYQPEAHFWKDRQLALATSSPLATHTIPSSIVLPTIEPFTHLSQHIERTSPKATTLLAALPAHLGSIQNVLTPKASDTEQTIIHVQDVHMNQEAQVNIGNTVAALLSTKKVDLVFLEGAFKPIDFKKYQEFPDHHVLGKAADYLLKENKISGPVHAALENLNSRVPYEGVDDEVAYHANVEAYKEAAQNQNELKKILARIENVVALQKSEIFNKELKEFDQHVQAYHQDQIKIGPYVSYLASKVETTSTNTDIFLEAWNTERTLNIPLIEASRNHLVNDLMKKLNQADTDELVQMSVAYRLGDLKSADFFQRLKKLCQSHGVAMEKYQALFDYVQYIFLSDSIKGDQLYADIAHMEDEAYSLLARTPAEKELIHLSKRLLLTKKLVDFSLTKSEWEEYKGVILSPAGVTKDLASIDMKAFETFYHQAERRDTLMFHNIQFAMKRHHAKVAVLVTGGFHSAGIQKSLVNAGITTVSFIPRITKVDGLSGSNYLSLFAQEKSPLDQLFEGEKLFLSPPPADLGRMPLAAAALAQTKQPSPLGPDDLSEIQKLGAPTVVATKITPGGIRITTRGPSVLARVSRERSPILLSLSPEDVVSPPARFALPGLAFFSLTNSAIPSFQTWLLPVGLFFLFVVLQSRAFPVNAHIRQEEEIMRKIINQNKELLAFLKRDQRNLLTFLYVDNLSINETAARLGKRADNVRQRRTSAYKAFEALLLPASDFQLVYQNQEQLMTLPPDSQEILKKRFLESKTLDEIGKELTLHKVTVMIRVHQALKRLKALVEPNDDTPEHVIRQNTRFFERLSPEERKILTYRYLEKWSRKRIANHFNISLKDVSEKCGAALDHLHDFIRPLERDPSKLVHQHRERLSQLGVHLASALEARFIKKRERPRVLRSFRISLDAYQERVKRGLVALKRLLQAPDSDPYQYVWKHRDRISELKPEYAELLQGIFIQGKKRRDYAVKRNVHNTAIGQMVRYALRDLKNLVEDQPGSIKELLKQYPLILNQLDSQLADILELRFRQGRSLREVARQLRITVQKVTNRQRSALRQFARKLRVNGSTIKAGVISLIFPLFLSSPANAMSAVSSTIHSSVSINGFWTVVPFIVLLVVILVSAMRWDHKKPILPTERRKEFEPAVPLNAYSSFIYPQDGTTWRPTGRLVPQKGQEQPPLNEEQVLQLVLDPRPGTRVVVVRNHDEMTYLALYVIGQLMKMAERPFSIGLATGGTPENLRKWMGLRDLLNQRKNATPGTNGGGTAALFLGAGPIFGDHVGQYEDTNEGFYTVFVLVAVATFIALMHVAGYLWNKYFPSKGTEEQVADVIVNAAKSFHRGGVRLRAIQNLIDIKPVGVGEQAGQYGFMALSQDERNRVINLVEQKFQKHRLKNPLTLLEARNLVWGLHVQPSQSLDASFDGHSHLALDFNILSESDVEKYAPIVSKLAAKMTDGKKVILLEGASPELQKSLVGKLNNHLGSIQFVERKNQRFHYANDGHDQFLVVHFLKAINDLHYRDVGLVLHGGIRWDDTMFNILSDLHVVNHVYLLTELLDNIMGITISDTALLEDMEKLARAISSAA